MPDFTRLFSCGLGAHVDRISGARNVFTNCTVVGMSHSAQKSWPLFKPDMVTMLGAHSLSLKTSRSDTFRKTMAATVDRVLYSYHYAQYEGQHDNSYTSEHVKPRTDKLGLVRGAQYMSRTVIGGGRRSRREGCVVCILKREYQ